MTDNLLFIISALFLTGLIALGAGLQNIRNTPAPPAATPATVYAAPAAPKPVSAATAPKPVRSRVYNRRNDDD